MIQFHETRMGMRFFESQLPKLIRTLERIADALEKRDGHDGETVAGGTLTDATVGDSAVQHGGSK